MKKATKLVHGGRHSAHPPKTVNLPIARASTVLFDSLSELAETQKLFDARTILICSEITSELAQMVIGQALALATVS